MDLIDQNLLMEMQRFNGIFAKSAIEKERLELFEQNGLAVSIQDEPRPGLRLIPPRRFHLTDKGRAVLAKIEAGG